MLFVYSGISWPVDYERFLSWFSIFTLNFPELVPLQCITPYDFHDKLRWVIGLMSTFNAAAAFLNFIVSKQHGERMEGIKNRLVYLWVMINYTTCKCAVLTLGSLKIITDHSFDCSRRRLFQHRDSSHNAMQELSRGWRRRVTAYRGRDD